MTRFEELKQTLLALPSPCPREQAQAIHSAVSAEMAQLPRVCTTQECLQLMALLPPVWGSTVVPKDQWIDPAKTYKTRSGKRVIGIEVKLANEAGAEYTFPVKASIVVREKPWQTRYEIFTLDGKRYLDSPSRDDLELA